MCIEMNRGKAFLVVTGMSLVALMSLTAGCGVCIHSTPAPSLVFLTYTDKTNGFSISYPQDWETVPEELLGETDIVGFWAPKAENQGKPILHVGKQECSPDASPERYFHAAKVALERSPTHHYQFIGKDELTIDGSPAIKHTFTYVRGEETLKAMQICFVKGGAVWVMTFLCAPEFFDSFKPAFDTIASSFHVF